MGLTWNTDMAYYNDKLISIADALHIQITQGETELKGKLRHAIDPNLPVKFVHCKDREDYFAVITSANWTEDDKEWYREMVRVHPLHIMCCEIVENLKDFCTDISSIYLDGIAVPLSHIINTEGDGRYLYGVSDDELDYIIPDSCIMTPDCTYYIEFNNEHKLNNDKIIKYRYLYRNSNTKIKVIEIDISDIVKQAHIQHSLDFTNLLVNRIVGENSFKRVVDLSSPAEEKVDEAYFGYCTYCKSPLELATNVNDESYDTLVANSEKVKAVHIRARHIPEEDYVSFGGALLHCPKCVHNRFSSLLCPECLSLRGNFVPLKLLYNPSKGIYLECPNRPTIKKLNFGDYYPEEDLCDFSMTIINKSDNWDSELINVKKFSNLYKTNTATKTRKRQKKFAEFVKATRSYR